MDNNNDNRVWSDENWYPRVSPERFVDRRRLMSDEDDALALFVLNLLTALAYFTIPATTLCILTMKGLPAVLIPDEAKLTITWLSRFLVVAMLFVLLCGTVHLRISIVIFAPWAVPYLPSIVHLSALTTVVSICAAVGFVLLVHPTLQLLDMVELVERGNTQFLLDTVEDARHQLTNVFDDPALLSLRVEKDEKHPLPSVEPLTAQSSDEICCAITGVAAEALVRQENRKTLRESRSNWCEGPHAEKARMVERERFNRRMRQYPEDSSDCSSSSSFSRFIKSSPIIISLATDHHNQAASIIQTCWRHLISRRLFKKHYNSAMSACKGNLPHDVIVEIVGNIHCSADAPP